MAKVKLKKQNDFFDQVYQVVRLIPYGRVSTYGAIAKYLGSSQSSRMVGYALHDSFNKVPPVPAHRVVNRNGMLTGKHFFENENEMQKLLEAEGILVVQDQVKHFEKVLWIPLNELEL